MCLCNELQYAAKFRSTSMDLSWDGTSSFPESNNFHAHWWSLEGYEGDWWKFLDRSRGLERSMVHTFEGRTQLKALAASLLIFSHYGRRPSVYCKRHAGYCAGGIFFCLCFFYFAHKPDHHSQRRNGTLGTKRGNPLVRIIECDPPFPHLPGDDYDLSRYSSLLELCASRMENPANIDCECTDFSRLRYTLGYSGTSGDHLPANHRYETQVHKAVGSNTSRPGSFTNRKYIWPNWHLPGDMH